MSAYSHWPVLPGGMEGGGHPVWVTEAPDWLLENSIWNADGGLAAVYLAMLQSGSMRWTVGSSMYSKVRLSLIWAWSTLTLIWTGPTPDREGAE